MRISIIGGGAAGFFAAINIARRCPNAIITIFEASSQPLAKVRISGGGRCNLTNSFQGIEKLLSAYPRGEKLMRRCFKEFDYLDAYNWFEDYGIVLTTQSDQCVFPVSQDAGEIVAMFRRVANELGVDVRCNYRVDSIINNGDSFIIRSHGGEVECDKVIVTTGGSPKIDGLNFLRELPIEFVDPVPSLFGLDIDCKPLKELSGAVIDNVVISIQGTKHRSSGTMLITHRGISGPATLKLSSYAARYLKEVNYRTVLLIKWIGEIDESKSRQVIADMILSHGKKLVGTLAPFGFSSRVWSHILSRADISLERRWAELGSKGINRIIAALHGDAYAVTARSTHREEFVTCGGVSISSINIKTLESRKCPGLYFAGEVLDVDAITGGFNLQAAWSSAYIVSSSICEELSIQSQSM